MVQSLLGLTEFLVAALAGCAQLGEGRLEGGLVGAGGKRRDGGVEVLPRGGEASGVGPDLGLGAGLDGGAGLRGGVPRVLGDTWASVIDLAAACTAAVSYLVSPLSIDTRSFMAFMLTFISAWRALIMSSADPAASPAPAPMMPTPRASTSAAAKFFFILNLLRWDVPTGRMPGCRFWHPATCP
jgi:hypothetical protein